ncbi:MAG: RNA polymerase sigma factor [Rhodanobacteraceae bacterium]|jgi:RNA polymerase sigma-70 factor (ECF subfamily)|nr:RNA polymerase sigma factor [Rhodanobacteraceae bacterium]MBK7044793.1 RNA polymerase sigma factor [Rhodanobacteraceae bacterium]MBP9154422.1 RNA polymerase sigma factor [Xanthomonadales bacterium]HQW81535.1 RNA polymerase sigma factor [Pseudomonadota bacterium]
MSAWTAVFAAHATELRAVLARVLGDVSLAEDCVQDTVMRLLDADFSSVRDPKAFLFQVGYNLARDALRRRHVRGSVVDDADAAIDAVVSNDAGPEVHLLVREQLAIVSRALAQLPDQRRRVLWLVRVEGLSLKETAATLGITAKTVENHMTQALRQLTELMTLTESGGIAPRTRRAQARDIQ